MKDPRSKLELYIAAIKRLYMWHFLAKKLGLILVTEFPKSGASWFCQMLRDATGLPFPRNSSPQFEKSILQGHNLFHKRMGKAIAIMRDGRDIMISAYYHFLHENDRNQSSWVNYHRSQVGFSDYDDIKNNLPAFIEYMFTGYAQKNRIHFSWSEFVQNIYEHKKNICIVKYEDLLNNSINEIIKSMQFYELSVPTEKLLNTIVDNYTFKKITNREQGQENTKSFARKGISGDWKNYFTRASCDTFHRYGGAALITAGYEQDDKWINQFHLDTD